MALFGREASGVVWLTFAVSIGLVGGFNLQLLYLRWFEDAECGRSFLISLLLNGASGCNDVRRMRPYRVSLFQAADLSNWRRMSFVLTAPQSTHS
jgi:hypothetical protein